MCVEFLKSSIGKKQIVATTGLLLIIFLIAHLAGNLLIFAGPEVFNAYAKKLADLRPGFYIMDIGLLLVFLIHIWVIILLIFENTQTAGILRYKVANSRAKISWATRLRNYTGLFILIFVVWHVWDFTFSDHAGPRSMIGNQSLGLYGVVYNSFLNPVHNVLYILAMLCVGFHLMHGIQSFTQTFGFNNPKYTPLIKNVSNWMGFLIAIGFSSIPVYVFFRG